MTKEQIVYLRGIHCSNDDSKYIVYFEDMLLVQSWVDCIIWDDEKCLIHVFRSNDGVETDEYQEDNKLSVFTSSYECIQHIKSNQSKATLQSTIDEFKQRGKMSEHQEKYLLAYYDALKMKSVVPNKVYPKKSAMGSNR